MSQDCVSPIGYTDCIILNIDGYRYTLVEDGILPVEQGSSEHSFQSQPTVTFGGNRYYLRVKGTLTAPGHINQARIRSYINEEGRLLQNGLNFLEERLAAHYRALVPPTTLQKNANGAKSQNESQIKGENASGSKEKEKEEAKQKVEPKVPQSVPAESMTLDEVDEILYEAMASQHVQSSLYKGANRQREKGAVKKWPRTTQFWWMVVDIALAIASARLLRWAFTFSRKRGEKMGPYVVLPKIDVPTTPTFLSSFEQAWNNETPSDKPLQRLVHWWHVHSTSSSPDPIFQRDEKSIYGLPPNFSSSPSRGSFISTYKEDNLLETLKCLVELRGQFDDLDCFFQENGDWNVFIGALELHWPPSAFEFMLPYIKRSKLTHSSIYSANLINYAIDGPERLLFAMKHLYFSPLVSNPVLSLVHQDPTESAFAKDALPVILAVAKMAKEGWCQIYTPPSSKSNSKDKTKTLSKKPILVSEDTIHQYDAQHLKPAPPIFVSENISWSVDGGNLITEILILSLDANDCTPHLTAIKALVDAGANLRAQNLIGLLPFSRIASTAPKNASSKKLREWLMQRNAHKPLYDTLKVTKDTNQRNLPVSISSVKTRSSKQDYSTIDSICSDTLKYSLIKGDIAAAKKALQNGDCLYVYRNGIPQVAAGSEMFYEIVRQGRIESLKLLHEYGFPLKDVFLRRHLFGVLPWSAKSTISPNVVEPGSNPADIYYRLVAEAWKVGNFEMVRYLTEVAKSNLDTDNAVEFHYQPFWYAIRMDHLREKEEEAKKPKKSQQRPFSQLLSSKNGSSSSSASFKLLPTIDYSDYDFSSELLPNSAKDYFESRFMVTNTGDPGSLMPASIYAVIIGSIDALKWMISRGWNIFEDKYEGATLLHFAAASGDEKMAEWILKHDNQSVSVDSYLMTAFDRLLMRNDGQKSLILRYMERAATKKRVQDLEPGYMSGGTLEDMVEGHNRFSALLNSKASIPCNENRIEWADATPSELRLFKSSIHANTVYSGFDSHDQIAVHCGLNRLRAFTKFGRGEFKKVALSNHLAHLRDGIEAYLTYRDTVLPNMDERDHNNVRARRYAQKNEKFASRLERGQVFTWCLVSDFAKRISNPHDFEIDFWIAWAATGVNGESLRHAFLMLSQFAGRNLVDSAVELYRREWLMFEPTYKGAISPLLELVAANPGKDSKFLSKPRFPGRLCRSTNLFVAIARAAPVVCEPRAQLVKGNRLSAQVSAKGWGTSSAPPEDANPGLNGENLSRPILVWMFTVLVPDARKMVALVSEVFIEVVLTGSIPMAEWLIDNCEIGNKNMDCYSMMTAQVATSGSHEMLKWLVHRGFPLRSLPVEEGLRLEAQERFAQTQEMTDVPKSLLEDFIERSEYAKLVAYISATQIDHLLSPRPNLINLIIAHYAASNACVPTPRHGDAPIVPFTRPSAANDETSQPLLCFKIDFLIRNGVPLFEAESHPDAFGWDASHYIALAGLDFLVDHLKRKHNVTMPNRKDSKGRTPEDLRKWALSKLRPGPDSIFKP